jgi:hypothetical protein
MQSPSVVLEGVFGWGAGGAQLGKLSFGHRCDNHLTSERQRKLSIPILLFWLF